MITSGVAHSYLVSGWCQRCGCKRTAEGNCSNCDRWFTHPLLTIGAPLVFSLLFLMLVGIRSLRDADPGFARLSNVVSGAPAVLSAQPILPRHTVSAALKPPTLFVPAVASTVALAPSKSISEIESQYAQLEALRETVHKAEEAYRSRGIARPSDDGPHSLN